MRTMIISALATIAIGLNVMPAAAAETSVVPPPNATPLPRFAQYHHYDWRGYRPACPYGYYFDCRIAPNGVGQCACWRDGIWWDN